MPRRGTQPIAFPCKSCGVRWQQYKGLCRRCLRTLGIFKNTREIDAARAGRSTAPAKRAPDPALPMKYREVDGVVFQVVFDGCRARSSEELVH